MFYWTGLAGSSRSSNDVLERRTSIGSGFFSFLNDGIVLIFSQILSIRVKKLCNTNFILSRHIKRENALLPVDVRRSKTPLLKLPCGLRSIAVLVGRANKPRRTRAVKPRLTRLRHATQALEIVEAFRLFRYSSGERRQMPHRSPPPPPPPPPLFFFCLFFAMGERLELAKTGLKLCAFDFDSVAKENQL